MYGKIKKKREERKVWQLTPRESLPKQNYKKQYLKNM
jgi:hypothetical protein